MKRTKKNILGIAGLSVVAATTVYAATMPVPGASAVSSSMTDTLEVRVVGAEPSAEMVPSTDAILETSQYSFKVLYENLKTATVEISRIGADGNPDSTHTVWTEVVNLAAGEKDLSLDLKSYGGYGHYILSLWGTDRNGLRIDFSSIELTYIEQTIVDPETGEVSIDVPSPEVKTGAIEVYIYDASGNVILGPIRINDPSEVEKINLSDYGLPDGVYRMEVVYYDEDGDKIDSATSSSVVVKEDDSTTVELEPQDEDTKKVVIEVRDPETGEVVKTVTVDDPGDKVDIDLSDLEPGDYDVHVIYYGDNPSTPIGDSDTEIHKAEEGTAGVELEPQDEDTKKVVIEVRDPETDEVVKTVTVDDPGKYVDIDLDGLDAGDYDVKIIYYGDDPDTPIGTSETEISKPADTSTIPVTIVPQDKDTDKVKIEIVDETGKVVKVIEVDDPGSIVNIPVDDLGAGNYTARVIYYGEDGKEIGTSATDFTKTTGTGDISVDVPEEFNSASSARVNFYDKDGNLVQYAVIYYEGDKMLIYVYDASGVLIRTEMREREADGTFPLPLAGLTSGNYAVEVIFYGPDGEALGEPFTTVVNYDAPVIPDSGAPDTGGLFRNLDISKADFLATGLIVFLIFAVVAAGIVAKNHKVKTPRRRK